MEDFEKEVKETVLMINNFKNGYLSCISELHRWNNGTDDPCHIDLYNHLITIENKINERVSDLLK